MSKTLISYSSFSLSISKWIHFSGGDDAVKRLFRRAFDSLTPNGIFIFEVRRRCEESILEKASRGLYLMFPSLTASRLEVIQEAKT